MAEEADKNKSSEPAQSEDIAAIKAEIAKEKDVSPPESSAPKPGGSLADARQQQYLDRALGRSTQSSLPRFTGNRLEALKASSEDGANAQESEKTESAKEVFEKQRSAEASIAHAQKLPVAGIFVLAFFTILGVGAYFYTQPKGDVKKPVEKARPTQGTDPARGMLLLNKAELSIQASNYKRALADLKTAYQIDPGNRAAYLEKIGECLTRVKEYKGAAAASHDLLELQPTNINALLQHAQASYMLGNKISARDDLYKAVQLAPNNAEVFLARGSFFKAEKEYSSALVDFKQALKLDPKIVGVKEKLAAVEAAEKYNALHTKPKVSIASHVVDSEPTEFTPAEKKQLQSSDLNSLRQAGLQAMTHNKFEFAVAALGRCVVINPNDIQSRKFLAYALINAGNASAAFDQFNAWDSLANLGLEDQLAFGRALTKAHDNSTTTAFFDFLVDDNSTNAQNLLRIAQIADKAGSSSSVQKAVDYGLKISSGNTKYQFTVLMRRVQTGQVGAEADHASAAPGKPAAQ